MSVDKGKPPLDIDSAVEYQKLKCEEKKTEKERATCYDAKLKEISDEQQKRAAIKAGAGGSVVLVFIIIVVVLGWYFLIKRPKLKAAKAAKEALQQIAGPIEITESTA